MKGVILWSILVTCVIATGGNNEKRDSETEIKGPGFYQYDLAILGAILALKFKAVLLVLAVIFGAGAYFKLLPGFGYQNKEYKCQPPVLYDSHHHGYNINHDIPYGHSERSDRARDVTEYSETLEFELLATIMRGIGLQDLSFNIKDKENGPCRRRFLCEADRLASKYPVVGYGINLLRSLSRYRTSRSATHRHNSCAELHPHCISRSQQHSQKNQET